MVEERILKISLDEAIVVLSWRWGLSFCKNDCLFYRFDAGLDYSGILFARMYAPLWLLIRWMGSCLFSCGLDWALKNLACCGFFCFCSLLLLRIAFLWKLLELQGSPCWSSPLLLFGIRIWWCWCGKVDWIVSIFIGVAFFFFLVYLWLYCNDFHVIVILYGSAKPWFMFIRKSVKVY